MFDRFVAPTLRHDDARPPILTQAIPVFGLGESVVAERLGDLMRRNRNPIVGTTASGMVVTVRLRAEGDAALDRASFDALAAEVLARVEPYALGIGACSLAEALGREAQARGVEVVLAESCSGGLAASMICEVPGASAWFAGGVVSYSNELKRRLLGVSAELIERHGAVSRECAEAMARGVLDRLGGSGSASITGIAGPDGGSEAKPVGTVFIATARRANGSIEVRARHFRFPGDRAAIRDRSARSALGALRLHLLDRPDLPLLWERPTR